MLRKERGSIANELTPQATQGVGGPEISKMNVAELQDLQRAVGTRIDSLKKENRRRAFEAVEKKAEEMGLSRSDLKGRYGGNGKGATANRPVPRYRHPDTGQTYSGRGRRPTWVKEFEANGGDLASIEIRKEN